MLRTPLDDIGGWVCHHSITSGKNRPRAESATVKTANVKRGKFTAFAISTLKGVKSDIVDCPQINCGTYIVNVLKCFTEKKT